MSLPKVLVFTAVYDKKDYCMPEFIEHAKKLTYPNYRHIFIDNSATLDYTNKLKAQGLEVYHVERGNNTREALARSQMFARDIAIKEGYDYMFSLESDIFPPSNIIEALMLWGKDVISGTYLIGNDEIETICATQATFNKELGAWGTSLFLPEQVKDILSKPGLFQVQAAGFGCCLVYKRVFRKLGFYYDPRFKGHSDIYFFNKCFENKIPVFIDTTMLCEHKHSDWTKVKDR